MKKILAIVCAGLLALSLVACGNGGAKADGVYTARADEGFVNSDKQVSGKGWTDELVITYANGAITNVEFNSYDADGRSKRDLPTEEYPMNPPPSEWMPQIEQNIMGAATPQDVDAIAGATSASYSARALYEGIQKDGKPGETITVTIEPQDEVSL